MRHPRQRCQQRQDDRDGCPIASARKLLGDLPCQSFVTADAGNDHGGGNRQQQRRHLRHQPVTNGEQHIDAGGLGQRQIMLDRAQDQAADYVDGKDKRARNGIALHEF